MKMRLSFFIIAFCFLFSAFGQTGYTPSITYDGTNFWVDGIKIIDVRQFVDAKIDFDNSTLSIKIGELPLKVAIKKNIAESTVPFNCRCGINGSGISMDETETLLWRGCSHALNLQLGDLVDGVGFNLSFDYQKGVYSDVTVKVRASPVPCLNPLHAFPPPTVVTTGCWPFDCCIHQTQTNITQYNAHVNSHIKTQVVNELGNNLLKLNIEDISPDNANVSGVIPVLTKVSLFGLLGPITPTTPATQLLLGGIINAFVNKIFTNVAAMVAAGTVQERASYDIGMMNTVLQEVLNGVEELQGQDIVTLVSTDFVSTKYSGNKISEHGGLWLNFSFNPTLITLINEKIKPLNNYYEQINLAGFELDKINSDCRNLIISLAGIGTYTALVQEGKAPLRTFDLKPVPPLNSYLNTYGDAIYSLPTNFINKTTMAVVGAPWISPVFKGNLSVDNPDNFLNDEQWGPIPENLAEKIQQAKAKMNSKGKVILLGKSMGGCKMVKVATELQEKGVQVDLLILVDGSCEYPNNDGAGESKNITTNVKKVHNFRQISISPYNDQQNGFQVSFTSPTKAYDVIVGDEGNDIGTLMCEGVGHNDIDECPQLLAKINSIIKQELNVDLAAILSLLLD